MKRLVDFVGTSRIRTVRPSVPEGLAVFAVGDIHGRSDLLLSIHGEIAARARTLPAATRKVVVYLGDYVDHGPDSAGVIDLLVAAPLAGFKSVFLMGNHEMNFFRFLRGERGYEVQTADWLYRQGGLATLRSYGVDIKHPSPDTIPDMRIQTLRRIPTDHLQFLEKLALNHCIGDYYFVHAGVDPARPLNDQRPSDMVGIGAPFLNSAQHHDKIIVHGHTPSVTPDIRHNRIGLDTAAHDTGCLSAVMLLRDKIQVFQTTDTVFPS